MASTEEQVLRLALDSGDFIGSLRKVSQQSEKAGKKGAKDFKIMAKGMEAAKKQAAGLGDKLKSGIALVGSLGAAMVGLDRVKGVVNLDAQYRKLAFSIRVATKQAHTSADVQKVVNEAAAATSRTSEEMAAAFGEVFGATKDLEFTKKVMNDIGAAANGTHEEVATVAEITQKMSRKFKVSAEDMKDALAQVAEGANQGGPNFQQMSETMDAMGATMIAAGLKGKKGLGFMIGALNATTEEMEGLGAQVSGIKAIIQKLGDPGALKTIAEKAGLSGKQLVDEKDALKRIQMVIKKGKKGMDALKATFVGPEERDALRILFTDPFDKALQRAKSSGLKGKDAIEAAGKFAEEGMKKFGQASFDGAALQAEADKEMKSPQASMRRAMETLTTSFAQPEIIGAIDDLAENMPALAKMFGNVVSFGAKNPILAGALGLGGHLGSGFFVGAAKQAGSALTKSFTKSIADKGLEFGQSAAKSLVKFGGSRMGKAMGAVAAVAVAWEMKKEIDRLLGKQVKESKEDFAVATQGKPKTLKQAQAQKAAAEVAIQRNSELSFGGSLLEQATGMSEHQENIRTMSRNTARRSLASADAAIAAFKNPVVTEPGPASAAPSARSGGGGSSGLSERLVASEMTNALAGVTLTVRMDTHGVPVTNVGGSGPRSLPPTMQGGGI